MNALERHLATARVNETEALNALQDVGRISDNCVTAADVADSDCARAIEWLAHRLVKSRQLEFPDGNL